MSVAPFKGDPFDALGDSNRRAIVELLGSQREPRFVAAVVEAASPPAT